MGDADAAPAGSASTEAADGAAPLAVDSDEAEATAAAVSRESGNGGVESVASDNGASVGVSAAHVDLSVTSSSVTAPAATGPGDAPGDAVAGKPGSGASDLLSPDTATAAAEEGGDYPDSDADDPSVRPAFPEASAPWTSRIVFGWARQLLREGAARELNEGDIWAAGEDDKAEVCAERLQQALKKHPDSLFRAMFSANWKVYASAGLFRIAWLGALITQVMCLREVVATVSAAETAAVTPDATPVEMFPGLWYALGLGAAAYVQPVMMNNLFFWSVRVGLRSRGAVSVLLFRKATRLSLASLQAGRASVANVASNDARRIQDAFTYGHFIWAGCFEVIVVLLLMAREVGISALAAGAVLLASVPLQFVFARRIGRVQASAVIHTDARTRCMQEVVSGVELIKLQAWEQPISDSVSHLRHNEVSRLKRAEVAKSANAAVFMAAPLLSALAAFATYIATGNRDLDAATAFATLAWANVALRSLIMIPRGATAASEALVSCDRVLRYLQQREAPAQSTRRGIQLCGAGGKEPVGRKPPPQAAADEGMAIVVRRASFAYAPASLDESGPESKEGRSSDKAQRQRSTSSAGDGFRLMEGLEAPVLLDIDLRVPKGALYVVVGEVAAGKSSLLSALLGDLFVVPSTDTASEPRGVEDTAVMELRGSTSYVPQRAWIANATLRKNVTFGRPFNAAKFERVVKACALEQDIARMPARERTEIGEGGTTLSGGQKQRVSLARACYAEPEVCLLDDVLSALDASVGRQVFDNVIADGGILAGSTRVMVTHALWCLPHATAVVVMRRGRIVATGPYDDLVARGVDFAALIEEDSGGEGEDGDVEAADVGAAAAASATGTEEGGDTTVIASPRQRAVSTVSKRSRRSRTASAGSGSATSEKRIDEDDEKAEKERIARERLAASGVLVAAEERDRGNVKGAVYAEYIRAGGGMLLFGVIILLFAGTQGLRVAADWWLSRWADDKESLSQGNYAWLYALFCVGYAVAMLVRTLSFTFALLRASSVLHNEMFAHVLRAPMQFFWSNPSGRILNRFSKDVDVCDKLLLKAATDLWNFATASFGSVVAVCAIMPWMLTVVIPLFGMFVCIARYYVQTSRQIKRLDAVSRSPIFQLFNDVAGADGVQSIRALHLRSVFERRFSSRVDVSISAYVAFETAARWLAVRLDSISATVALSVAVLGILLRESIGAGLLGAALAQVLLLSGMLQYSTRQAAEVESFMTSVQRVAAYGKIDTEAAPVLDGDERLLASGWPSKGRLEFRDVELRYAPHLPLALRGVSFATKPAEKIGVVGRTGGGKSTLGNAIFRIVEICGGAIVLDGTNLADIGLDAVRRSVSVIPQSPVLFSGSLRSNLDPFNEFADDAELWTALRRVHLADTVGALPAQLASRVAEGGENWSAGQRQLLCLARALLRASKVIFVDEATANVDAETDALVQRIIRNEFKSCTVVTVAHRLNTIIDSDRVLCMKDGCVANLDTPAALLADKSSLLYKLVEETGPESAKLLRKQVAAKANSLEPKEVAKE